MLPEQQNLIYKHFVELVRDCDLERILRNFSSKDPRVIKILDNVKFEDDRRHNNRCILFQLLKTPSPSIFPKLTESLREHKFEDLANKLENKPNSSCLPLHKTCCFKLPDNLVEEPLSEEPHGTQLKIDVTYAMKFCDTDEYSYRTRSRNRGQVLIVNNIHFDNERYRMRRGAEVDESNLRELFEQIGFSVDMYRNLSRDEIKTVTRKFAQMEYETAPDAAIVIIMSHGDKIDNRTVIIGSDGQVVEEEWIVHQFNNQSCPLFKNKPKILIFNICRGSLVDNWHFAQHTQSDSACTKQPEITDDDERYYSDLMICHPSVEGYQAHRDTIRGCWYIELICKVFMEHAHNSDVEAMLKLVERELKTRISEKRTRQTSTFLNIAFRTCYLNPGIYEENGAAVPFKHAL